VSANLKKGVWPMRELIVIKPEQRSTETAQTPGLVRAAAISMETTGSTRIWMGYAMMPPGSTSGPHHHGDCESGIYMVKGHARFYGGEHLEEVRDAGPGDFIFVPPWAIHQETNLSETEPVEMIVVRDSQETLVYNVDVSRAESG